MTNFNPWKMDEPELEFDTDYVCGPFSRVDWVAGGNFDGYVYQKVLRFREEGQVVHYLYRILDQSYYDDHTDDQLIRGTFAYTDHRTITCTFPGFSMRGKLISPEGRYIAFSVSNSSGPTGQTECFEKRPTGGAESPD